MAVNYYNKMNSAYKDNKETTTARNKLLAIGGNAPVYTDTYAGQIEKLYNQVRGGQDFNYNPNNDAAYRQYADQYRALAGLAITGNQAQAQDLTGGYGSTYAPEIARQGLARLNEGVEAAQPAFLELAQQKYWDDRDALYNQGNAVLARQQADLENYSRESDAWNTRYGMAANKYADTRDTSYANFATKRDKNAYLYNYNNEKMQNNQEMQLQKFETYNKLAGNKCADFNEKKDNKGMKAYLAGLVKAGKITQYMADNLYKQYKYEAPKTGGGGGGRRSSGRYYSRSRSGGSGASDAQLSQLHEFTSDWLRAHNSLVLRRVTEKGTYSAIESDFQNGKMSEMERDYLLQYLSTSEGQKWFADNAASTASKNEADKKSKDLIRKYENAKLKGR